MRERRPELKCRTMKRNLGIQWTSTIALLAVSLMCNAQTKGPEKGYLLIDGGGEPDSVKQRFVKLAGGADANVVLIPTALSDQQLTAGGFFVGKGKGWAKSWGLNHVTMLHSRDKERSSSEFFVQTLRNASGVWIMGGRQWRLADAYLDTAVEREIKALLARGGVVGGSSAGATIQGSYLVRGDSAHPGNPDGDNRIMMSPDHEEGFGLLPNSAIDQHVNVRGREHDLLQVVKKYPDLLGIGIDEGAWIEVHGDSFKVFGGQVVIYDTIRNGENYIFLSPGETFNLQCVHVHGAC